MVFTPYKPSWAQFEKDMHSDDSEKARAAAVKFDESRKEELKNDPTARRWEQSRKESIAKDKPQFVKERIKKEQDEYAQTLEKYLNGGIVMGKFNPAPGFVLVKEIKIDKTTGGIYLPEGSVSEDVAEPPRGMVVAVGKAKVYGNGVTSEAPCKVGDVVAYKFHTMIMLYNNEKHHFMSFEDIFGVIEEG